MPFFGQEWEAAGKRGQPSTKVLGGDLTLGQKELVCGGSRSTPLHLDASELAGSGALLFLRPADGSERDGSLHGRPLPARGTTRSRQGTRQPARLRKAAPLRCPFTHRPSAGRRAFGSGKWQAIHGASGVGLTSSKLAAHRLPSRARERRVKSDEDARKRRYRADSCVATRHHRVRSGVQICLDL